VVDELGALLFDDIHQASDAKHVVGFCGTRSSGHDELAWVMTFHLAENRSECIGLRNATRIVFRCPGVVRLDGHATVPDQRR
jgi:hypothetical protein